MFKVGDKAKGFKFTRGTDGVSYVTYMNELEGIVGEVAAVYKNSFTILFKERGIWEYPASLWHLAKVGEDEPPKIGEKFPFKAGDRVKFTESSLASGMIDAKEGDVFTVKESYIRSVTLKELQGCYHVTHFEHVQEEVVDNTEEQEIDWQVGQEVWCLIFGKGKVFEVDRRGTEYPVGVDFGNDTIHYTVDGRFFSNCHRTLFFSEPKIEVELFPPKKPFSPTLKKGELVVIETDKSTSIQEVVKETEDMLYTLLTDYNKSEINVIFKLSEKVEFE